ncbi:hypothetical protein VIGAN_11201700 [Vigna angularis var. angularis]|uniref:Gnk2-homologous domain-containing protein n=1 Tax=Vigna angularis var. angularis TaxID=157739 RepID=A0A0S3TCA9_PHAAN|nr:hypothetical protein VIGAN_11201700 [Vigna angularis var. angularis]
MCRGDVTNHICQECIRTAARKISQVCPNALPEKYLPSLLSSLFLTHCLFIFFLFSLCFYFAVSATLRYGYYRDSFILLGPASSRLITTSSVFVKQLQVSSKDKNQVFVHTFNKKLELSSQTNWTASDFSFFPDFLRQV